MDNPPIIKETPSPALAPGAGGPWLAYPVQRPLRLDALNPGGLPDSNGPFDLTVIVPAYNVARYLTKCLASIVTAPGLRLQLIVINDGSADDTLKVALDFARGRPDLACFVLDQENRGLSAARNLGIDLAQGEFLCFLDSDDFFAPNPLPAALALARTHDLDLVLFRTLIFDERRLEFWPFYDAETWLRLLGPRHYAILNGRNVPDLLLLEPNANTRIVRTSFMRRAGIRYPGGLHYEDVAVHVQQTMGARRLGLLGSLGYVYRVGRPGKITDERSQRRFDVIVTAAQAIEQARSMDLSPFHGGCLLASLTRIVCWCGANVRLADRQLFFSQAAKAFAAAPPQWMKKAILFPAVEERMRIRLLALVRGDVERLCADSMGRPLRWPLRETLRRGRYGSLARAAWRERILGRRRR